MNTCPYAVESQIGTKCELMNGICPYVRESDCKIKDDEKQELSVDEWKNFEFV